MRTISKLGILLGFFVAGASIWRWMVIYDSPFRLIVGLFIAVSLMAWGWTLDWRTEKDKWDQNIKKRIDSLRQEIDGKYEQMEALFDNKKNKTSRN